MEYIVIFYLESKSNLARLFMFWELESVFKNYIFYTFDIIRGKNKIPNNNNNNR